MQRFPRFLAPAFRGAFSIMHDRTASLLRQTRYPVFHSHEYNQTGADFGTRITNAVAQVFEQGYRSVLVVGNDCPDLSLAELKKAISLLDAGHNVLGPSTDGGAYLIGLQQEAFDPAVLQRLPWSTSKLFPALRQHLADAGTATTQLLQPHTDLDHAESIRRWLKHGVHSLHKKLGTLLRALLAIAPPELWVVLLPPVMRSVAISISLRGPPRYA